MQPVRCSRVRLSSTMSRVALAACEALASSTLSWLVDAFCPHFCSSSWVC